MSKITFNRIESSTSINDYPVEDGSFWVTGDGKSYIDYGENRIPIAGTPDTQMSDISRNTVENNVIKDYVDDKIDTVNTAIGVLQGEIIWTNSSPTSNFPAQTINLNESLDNYDMYEILFRQSTTAGRIMTTGKIPVGYGTILNWNANAFYYRATGTTVSGSTITFEDGKNGATTANGYTVPLYVIGYKTGLFE